MARTAVIAGTASATAGAVQRHGAQKAAAQQAAAAPPPAPAPPAPAPVAAAPVDDDVIAKLQQLGDLKAQGILDDAEFAAAKAKLLA
jgi:hypothetical protein